MKIVFYDVETSGLEPTKHEVIQVAAIAFEVDGRDWRKLASFERKMKFDMDKADPKALEINCYSLDVWERDAVSQAQGLAEFDAFVSTFKDVRRESKKTGNPFYCLRTGGHNVKSFDDGFIRAWYGKRFCPLDYMEVFDTLELAKWKLRFIDPGEFENLKLETLCAMYGVELEGAHDALADVTANARLAWKMIHSFRPGKHHDR